MGSFDRQVKARTMEFKGFFKRGHVSTRGNVFTRGIKAVENSCKKGWYKVRHLRR